jgi:hypothetical protein
MATTTDKMDLESTELKGKNRNNQEHVIFKIFTSRAGSFEIPYHNSIVKDKSFR